MIQEIQKPNTLSIFVSDLTPVSEDMVRTEIIIFRISDDGCIVFNAKELAKLRDVLRTSLGKHADELSDEDLRDFGSSMLQATAVVLKAKYSLKKAAKIQ